MSAPGPYTKDGWYVSFTVKVDGKAINNAFQVVSVDVWTAMNKLPKARLVISDGSPAEETFPISDLKTFLPGNKIEIAAGYSGRETTIFRGLILKQGLEIDQTNASRLIVDCTDLAMKMTLERKNALFEKIKDSELIGKLISANGLAKDVAATNTVHEEIVQYYATDWDLMMLRAEMNGFVVIAEGGKVTVKEPDSSQSSSLLLRFGESILDFDAEMDASTQLASSAIKSATWDPDTQKLIESGPGAVNVKEAGNVSSAELAKVFNVKRYNQQTGGPIEKSALQDWSSAELLRSKLAKIRGTVRFQGSTKAQTGEVIELAGVGARFNGPVVVSGVHHRITDGEWLTTAAFGLSPQWFAAEVPNVAAPCASGQLPPIQGLQTGIVKQVAKDPGGEFRVLVGLPILQDMSKGVWARLGSFYASNKIGAVFYPEIGDEVVVAFMNEDPRFPVIVGSLYSKKLAPPVAPDAQNNVKAIVTRSKLQISFDDKSKVIEIRTPGKHILKLDDTSGAISIQDSNGNRVSLSKGGIALDSASNLKLTAKGNVSVQAGANLTLSAKANASMDGLQVAHKAKAKFSAAGSAAAEVTSTGMLTVRGTLVKIN
jgi:Rhs element Vgr protein